MTFKLKIIGQRGASKATWLVRKKGSGNLFFFGEMCHFFIIRFEVLTCPSPDQSPSKFDNSANI